MLIGLAGSKLLSRVLTRISGKLVIEGDIHSDETTPTDVTPETKPKATNIMAGDVQQPEKKPVEKPKVSFVEKLGVVVDDKDYAKVIQELLKEGAIKTPDKDQNVLRTKDENLATELFNIIEDRKDLHDSSKNDE
jgi:hypothetical protein